jgi:C1A family cysteine protease
MAATKFMDLTNTEFKTMFLGLATPTSTKSVTTLNASAVPESVDWRTGATVAVNKVKDQGQCGSCWAFSTVGALEGASALFGAKKLLNLSEKQLVDCSSSFGNEGCNGGLMDNAFKFVIKNGIAAEDKYPYKPVSGKCTLKTGDFKISSFTDVEAGDVDQLAAAVAQQPVSIAVDANNFQFYSSGVFSDCKESLDHGVTLIGYTKEAWIVRNSWGESWGESGYIRLARGNTCGLANAASYPVL